VLTVFDGCGVTTDDPDVIGVGVDGGVDPVVTTELFVDVVTDCSARTTGGARRVMITAIYFMYLYIINLQLS
jgi:hypothetical protein